MLGAPKKNDLVKRFLSKEILSKINARIREVRNNKYVPDFSRAIS